MCAPSFLCALVSRRVLYNLYMNSLQSSQPTYLRELFTIQPINPLYSILLLSHPLSTTSHFSSHVPQTEPYPSLHLVFEMTFHLNPAPFLYLHHRHCQSQDIIFIRLLYPLPPGLQLKIKISSLQTFLGLPLPI